ncbi:MAG: hypothetical protein V1928_02860 [Parcubacteria group bacterium]
MSSKKAFWKNDSGGAIIAKVVISSNAYVVGRNYEIKEFRSGDIGLHARLDLNGQSLSELPDEQKRTAVKLFEDMSESLLADLGKKKNAQLLSEGAVVFLLKRKAKKPDEEDEFYYGTVEAQTEQGIRLRMLNGRPARVEVKFFPWDREFTEVPGYSGWLGLIKYLLLEVKYNPALKFIGENDEDVLTEVLIAQSEDSWGDHLDTEALIKRVATLKKQSNVRRVMDEAKHKGIRREALKLVENQDTIVAFLLNPENRFEHMTDLLDKINDQEVLKKIICNSNDYEVLKKAVAKFSGLADDFALEIKSSIALHYLFEANKLTDLEVMRKIYDNCQDEDLKRVLMEKLNTQDEALRTAVEAEDMAIAEKMIFLLRFDFPRLTEIIVNAKLPETAVKAFTMMAQIEEANDSREMQEEFNQGKNRIILESKHKEARLAAVERIYGNELDKVALNKKEEADIRLLALERMYQYPFKSESVAVLQQLESDEKENPQIREAAKAKRIEIERKNMNDKLYWHSDEMSQAELERVLSEQGRWEDNLIERMLAYAQNAEAIRKFISGRPERRVDSAKDAAQKRLDQLDFERINATTDVEVLRKIIAERKASESVLAEALMKFEALEKERIRKLVFSGGGVKQSELVNVATDESEDVKVRSAAINMIDDRILLRRMTSDHLFAIQTAAEKRLLQLKPADELM